MAPAGPGVTPPAPCSPLPPSELGKKHLQGEASPDDAALNSSSRARGSHISHNTTVGSSVGRERPRGSCRTRLIDPWGSWPHVLHVLGCGQGHPRGPKHGAEAAQAFFAWPKFGKAQDFQQGSVRAFPFSHCGTHVWEGSKAWWPETLF